MWVSRRFSFILGLAKLKAAKFFRSRSKCLLHQILKITISIQPNLVKMSNSSLLLCIKISIDKTQGNKSITNSFIKVQF